jgi:putative ABC transport system permease protein
MRALRVWWRRFAGLFQTTRREREMAAELESHFQLHVDDNLRAGMSLDEARRIARLKFGPVEAIKEEYRDRTSIRAGEAFGRDARDAVRHVRWRPGFTAIVVITLALGVGANAAMFGLVDDLMLRPPDGVRDPDRVVAVTGVSNYVDLQDLRPQLETLELAAYTRRPLSFGRGVDAIEIRAECVTPEFFPVLGATPIVGRAFEAGEDALGKPRTAILSHGFWRRQFGGVPEAVGRDVSIAGRAHTIVGVAAPAFNGVQLGAVDVWILIAAAPEACSFSGANLLRSQGGAWLRTVGRIRDGVNAAAAAADLRAARLEPPPGVLPEMRARLPRPGLAPIAAARNDGSTGMWQQTRLAWWLAGGAAVLLLIACANVAGLLSTRALERRGEIAIRLQLGATRRRLFAQLLMENLVLAALCCGVAVLFAMWMGLALRAYLPIGGDDVFDARSTAVLIGFAAIAGLLSGVVPALQASRADLVGHFRSGLGVRQTRIVFRHLMLVAQVALALVLVVASGLFIRSVQNFRADFAYDLDDVVVVAIDFKKAGVDNGATIRDAYERMLERLRQLPEVRLAAARSGTFVGVGGSSMITWLRHSAADRPNCCHLSASVTPEYFDAVGLRFIQGRTFTPREVASGSAIVLNEDLARTLFPGGQAVGKCVLVGNDPCREVAGVVEATRRGPLRHTQLDSEFFVPFREHGEAVPQLLLLRPATMPEDAMTAIAAAVRSVSTELPYITVATLADLVDVQARSWRMGATIFGLFGTLAVVLAGIGVYATAAFSVRERTGEFGVRIALGARRRDVMALVVRHGALVLAAGSVLGGIAAWSVGGALQSVLVSVSRSDVRAFAAAAAILATACIAGCLVPAWRAARVDPAVALRQQ